MVFSVGACPVGAGSSGGPTGGYWAEVTLNREPYNPGQPEVAFADSVKQFVSGRDWWATLPIPTGLPPGPYVLQATCLIQRLTFASYTGLPITVSAATG